jgi:glycosyltransferase involved in cell wall biosynthesis
MEAYCRPLGTVQYREFSPNRLKALLGFLSPRPRAVVDTYSQEMAALVEKTGANDAPDIVVACQLRSAPYALRLKQRPCVFEEIELTVAREQFLCQPSLTSRARYGLRWWKLSSFIGRLLRQFDGCTVVSERERDLVLNIVPEYNMLSVVPNGVDLDTYTGSFGTPKPDTLIYSGSLTYSANFDAMDFFLNDVFPQVKASRPEATLRITGRSDGVPLDRLPLGNGAELTGYLDDIRPAIAQSWMCVVPLQIGGGTRLKILEAMALGTPVISTSKGAEGLDITPGEDILIADEATEFADAVTRLLSDPALRARLAAGGRRLVEERYSWETCAQALEQLLHRVTRRSTERRTERARSGAQNGKGSNH